MGSAPIFLPAKVIVHHAATSTDALNIWPAIRAYHVSKGWMDIGYHAGAGRSIAGQDTFDVIMGRPWDMPGAHTIGQNSVALGICFLGNYEVAAPPQSLLITGAKLIALWLRLFKIPSTEIYAHKFYNATECPGALFPMDTLKALVEAAL